MAITTRKENIYFKTPLKNKVDIISWSKLELYTTSWNNLNLQVEVIENKQEIIGVDFLKEFYTFELAILWLFIFTYGILNLFKIKND